MICLVNFNTYLGGGETLFVRWGQYLNEHHADFKLFYKTGSYIENDLKRFDIDKKHLCPISSDVDYYYLDDKGRRQEINEVLHYLGKDENPSFVSFCARDLYMLFDLVRPNNFKLSHLVLHYQDNLYVSQSLCDKLLMRLFKVSNYSRKRILDFNKKLFNEICNQSVVIPQSELQSDLWNDVFKIKLDKKLTTPLPVCDFSGTDHDVPAQNNKIIWIGRIVDFKIPALCAMIDFVGNSNKYSFSIVGDGNIGYIRKYIQRKGYDNNKFQFLGKVAYSNLPVVIKECSIGYAMGTSIIEIGKHGIPVIMALASPDYKQFNHSICGGVYIDESRGNVGDTLYYENSSDKIVYIEDAIKDLENNFSKLAVDCYNTLKLNFDSTTNFGLYMTHIKCARRIESDLKVPFSSLFRRVVFKLSKNMNYE